jgi:hypothetical protein
MRILKPEEVKLYNSNPGLYAPDLFISFFKDTTLTQGIQF